MKKRRLETLHKKQPQMGSIEEETLRDTESRIRQIESHYCQGVSGLIPDQQYKTSRQLLRKREIENIAIDFVSNNHLISFHVVSRKPRPLGSV